MLLAWKDVDTKELIEAEPVTRAICPGCKNEVIAVCGDFNIWHWRHIAGECIYDHESETQWHLEWKNNALKIGMEVEKIFDPCCAMCL